MSETLRLIVGILLGFFISQITDYLNTIRRRRSKNYNILVLLDRRLNDLLDSIVIVTSQLDSIKTAWDENAITLETIDSLNDDLPDLDLPDINLINDIFSLRRKIVRLNADLRMMRSVNQTIIDISLTKSIAPEELERLTSHSRIVIPKIIIVMDELNETIKQNIVYVRLRLKFDKSYLQKMNLLQVSKINDVDLKIERRKLDQDIARIEKESKEEIDRMMNKV